MASCLLQGGANPNISAISAGGYGSEGGIQRTAVDFAIEARCERPLWALFQQSHGVALDNWNRRALLAEAGKGKGRAKSRAKGHGRDGKGQYQRREQG